MAGHRANRTGGPQPDAAAIFSLHDA